MTSRPLLFVSAVSRELHSARQLVANTLIFLGYQPIWQDIFGTEGGDLRELLRRQIDQCAGVVQLVGQCYGAEPPTTDEEFGRVSYTQYEALYARKQGKKVWYLFIDERYPRDACNDEPAELRELQAAYRERLNSDTHVYHQLASSEALEASVLKLRDELRRLRRGVTQWAIGVTALLLAIVGLSLWLQRGQTKLQKGQAALERGQSELRFALMSFEQTEVRVHQAQPNLSPDPLREETYIKISNDLHTDPKILRKELPRFAAKRKDASDATVFERANANYVTGNYLEAERLALQAAGEAQKTDPTNTHKIIGRLKLAGLSAQKAIQYRQAMEHFRAAEKLADPECALHQV